MKTFFYNLLENDEYRLKRWFDISILILILTSTISFLISLSSPHMEKKLEIFDYIVLFIFIIEYLLRFWVSSDAIKDFNQGYQLYRRRGYLPSTWNGFKKMIAPKVRFMTRPMSIIDLLAILPFLRIFRMFRLLRLLRLLKIVRYSRSMENFMLVFRDTAFEFGMVLSVLLFFLIFAASTIYIAERDTVADIKGINSLGRAFWWSIVTLSTVGYGDMYPHSFWGKFVGSLVMIIGIGVCALPAGIIAAGLTERINKLKEGAMTLKNLKNHILICGWTNKSLHMLDELKTTAVYKDHEVVVVSSQKEVNYPGSHFFHGDFTKESVLNDVGCQNAFCAIIMAEKIDGASAESIDARSILAAFLLDKNLPKNANLMVEILIKDNAAILNSRLPRAYIMISDEVTGNIMNNYVMHPGITTIVLELISQQQNSFHQIIVQEIRKIDTDVHKFLDLFRFFRDENSTAIPIGIARGSQTIVNPENNLVLQDEDIVFYIGREAV